MESRCQDNELRAPAGPKVRLDLAYDGTDFGGWQRQAGGPKPTVQETLERALTRIFNARVRVCGASRTDAGVHARHQVVHFTAPKSLENSDLAYSINCLTPSTLSVSAAFLAPVEFHAIRSAQTKKYVYRISNQRVSCPLSVRFSTWIRRPLDLERLNELSRVLVGSHDFSSFKTKGTNYVSTVRRIHSAEWRLMPDRIVEFHVVGNGFLKQMVRNLVGTLLHLESAGHGPDHLRAILAAKDRQAAGSAAPPQGLFLDSIHYPADLDRRCIRI